MTSMFTQSEAADAAPTPKAPLVVRRARLVLALSVLVVVLAAVVGSGAVPKLKGGGFEDPSSPSSQAKAALQETFGRQEANLVLLVTAADGRTVDDPAVAADARAAVSRLEAETGVTVLGDYWDASGPAAAGLRSTDSTKALVVAHVAGGEDEVRERSAELEPLFTTTTASTTIQTGGFGQANVDINGQVTADLATAEAIAIPLTLALLVVVFGAVVAGLLPLLVGGIAIAGTFAALALIAEVTDVSIFALNLTTALGLGLGIDYSLLVVSRFREELALGRSTSEAVAVTLRTAGRTVLFSSGTIAVALAALVVFPLYFLRSFAYAGIAVVGVAAVAAVVTLPALLAVLGPRVDLLRVGRRRSAVAGSNGGWARWAAFVMRRPVLVATPVVAVLAVMAAPFLGVNFGLPDDRVLPASVSQARQVGDALRTDFAEQSASSAVVVLPTVSGGTQAVGEYAQRLSALPSVSRVDSAAGTYVGGRQVAPAVPQVASTMLVSLTGGGQAAYLEVVPSVDPYSDAAQDLVTAVRSTSAPTAGDTAPLVGGPSATLVDVKASIGARLPLAIGLIVLSTFVLLFLFTGSVVLPLKALLTNAITIVAVVGAMVWVFQEGHFSSLLGFTPMPLSITMPLLMFCVAFGLSMDYEVFLLGRIKELRDAGADTPTAVAAGLERTGRIVTTAALLLAITMFAFVSSKVSFIQMFGLGTGLAIVMDATLVRGVLVPAMMRILGDVNWWAPRWMKAVHARFGLSEGEAPAPPAAAQAPVTPALEETASTARP